MTLVSLNSLAAGVDPSLQNYLTIDRVETSLSEEVASDELVPSDGVSATELNSAPSDGEGGASELLTELKIVDVIVDKIVTIGTKIWKIVDAGKPVVSAGEMRASALPQGATDWRRMTGWQAPRSRTFRVEYKNLYGMTVVDYSFRITYTYGGSVEGVGKYLTNVSVAPAVANVAWGFTFDSSAYVPSVVNLGSKARPVAGMELQIKWNVKTLLQDNRQQEAYFIDGNGGFKTL